MANQIWPFPDILVAENGYVIRRYEIDTDSFVHVICKDAAEVRTVLAAHAAQVIEGAVAKLAEPKPPLIVNRQSALHRAIRDA